MDRRDLLRGLLALPISGTLSALQDRPKYRHPRPPAKSGTLSVVVDGAFAIVLQQDRRSRVRVFTPRDRENHHKFHFFDGPERYESKRALRHNPTDRTYHFELLPDGLQSHAKTEVDARLSDFNVRTDKWCQEDYFVTIDLPAPKRITFIPPLAPVTLRDGHRTAQMPFNHVLEYSIADRSKVKMALQDAPEFGPLSCTELSKLYEEECREYEEHRKRDHDYAGGRDSSSCSEVKREFGSACPESNAMFFFGVGLPPHNADPCHAVRFFNDRILESFPRLREKLEIESFGTGGMPCPNEGYKTRGALKPALFQRGVDEPRLREASYVVDCQVSGPVVSFGG